MPSSRSCGAERGGAVDGQGRTERAREERAAVEARARGRGHAGLDRRQPVAGFGHGAAKQRERENSSQRCIGGSRSASPGRRRRGGAGRSGSWAGSSSGGRRRRRRHPSPSGRSVSSERRVVVGRLWMPQNEIARGRRACPGSDGHLAALRVLGVVGVLLQHAAGHRPSGRGTSRCRASGRRSSRDTFGRVEEQLAGLDREPDPVLRRDAVAERAQHPGEVDGRRLHHARPLVQARVLENRAQDLPRRVAGLHVERLERRLRLVVGRLGDEVAPQLAREERLVGGMLDRRAGPPASSRTARPCRRPPSSRRRGGCGRSGT